MVEVEGEKVVTSRGVGRNATGFCRPAAARRSLQSGNAIHTWGSILFREPKFTSISDTEACKETKS